KTRVRFFSSDKTSDNNGNGRKTVASTGPPTGAQSDLGSSSTSSKFVSLTRAKTTSPLSSPPTSANDDEDYFGDANAQDYELNRTTLTNTILNARNSFIGDSSEDGSPLASPRRAVTRSSAIALSSSTHSNNRAATTAASTAAMSMGLGNIMDIGLHTS